MKQSAVDRAYVWLRERILDGTLAGGTFVDEAMICAGADVSRTPAREALNRLEGERFVTLVPRRGAQVTELNASDLADAYRARVMVESFAAEDFCRAQRPVPQEMRDALAELDQLSTLPLDLPTRVAYQEADQRFHSSMVRTLGNAPILNFFESLWRVNRWAMISRSDLLHSHAFMEENMSQHHQLIESLEEHDLEKITAVLRQHLRMAQPYSSARSA
jgi:Transcriptional regulators